ncbi:hypothetical protein CcI49_10320 [Frankia sp. CcI49]|nr:hypothetical protein ACG83_37420 [Frankia sp. R43]ONH60699.1 hypothetical protein CcI49_10320 [Frankia sp. CcI49]
MRDDRAASVTTRPHVAQVPPLAITVAGRPAAVLGPVSPRGWRRRGDLAELFAHPEGTDLPQDRNLVDVASEEAPRISEPES